MKSIIIVLIIFVLGCQNNIEQKISKKTSQKELLKPFIHDFLNFISTKKDSSDLITLYCKKINDTITFNIISAYPELGVEKFNGFSVLEGYRICCIGDSIPESFFNIEYEGKIPADVIKKNKEVNKSDIVPNTEPILWTLYFKNAKLVRWYPEDELKKFCKSCAL